MLLYCYIASILAATGAAFSAPHQVSIRAKFAKY